MNAAASSAPLLREEDEAPTPAATAPPTSPSMSSNHQRGAFSSRAEYVLSMVGYTVGLGNVWRWPYQCFSNGGAAFLVVYLVLLATVAMPVFLLEVAVGQRFRSTPVPIWSAIHPALCGLGWAATVSSYVTAWYYNVIDAWSLYYLGASVLGPRPFSGDGSAEEELDGARLPWAERDCTDDFNVDVDVDVDYDYDGGAAVVTAAGGERSCAMNATIYWEDRVLSETASVNDLGALNWPLAGCLALAWFLVFAVLARGVESAGKVVYFTATFPYVVLLVLLARGLTLPGAGMGLRFLFVPDAARLADWRVWVAALNGRTVQMFTKGSRGGHRVLRTRKRASL